MQLFVIDPKTRLVKLDEEWISTIKEFKAIIVRNKKNHEQSIKEFTFLYHYCDYRSKFNNYSEEDKLRECIKNADLDDNFNIETDLDLLAAVVKYKDLQKAPSLVALREIREGLHTSIRFVRKFREVIDAQIANLDIAALSEPEEGKKKGKSALTVLDEAVTALTKRANELPTTIKMVNELEEKVKAEMAEDKSLRGNSQKGEREDKDSMTARPDGKRIFN
jgi:hypothetical protein